MKLYIPEIGDVIRLIDDWTFDLYNESRNETLMMKMHDPRAVSGSWDKNNYGAIPCTIPAGAELKIDRIYIRKGKGDYSSITFLWKGERIPGYTKPRQINSWADGRLLSSQTIIEKYPASPIRFWAKLEDVNKIEFE